jgi:hypothetical protein
MGSFFPKGGNCFSTRLPEIQGPLDSQPHAIDARQPISTTHFIDVQFAKQLDCQTPAAGAERPRLTRPSHERAKIPPRAWFEKVGEHQRLACHLPSGRHSSRPPSRRAAVRLRRVTPSRPRYQRTVRLRRSPRNGAVLTARNGPEPSTRKRRAPRRESSSSARKQMARQWAVD